MKWRDVTPQQLRETASHLRDTANDLDDRETVIEHTGHDLFAIYKCVARRLEREATRREARTEGIGEDATSTDEDANVD